MPPINLDGLLYFAGVLIFVAFLLGMGISAILF